MGIGTPARVNGNGVFQMADEVGSDINATSILSPSIGYARVGLPVFS